MINEITIELLLLTAAALVFGAFCGGYALASWECRRVIERHIPEGGER